MDRTLSFIVSRVLTSDGLIGCGGCCGFVSGAGFGWRGRRFIWPGANMLPNPTPTTRGGFISTSVALTKQTPVTLAFV